MSAWRLAPPSTLVSQAARSSRHPREVALERTLSSPLPARARTARRCQERALVDIDCQICDSIAREPTPRQTPRSGIAPQSVAGRSWSAVNVSMAVVAPPESANSTS